MQGGVVRNITPVSTGEGMHEAEGGDWGWRGDVLEHISQSVLAGPCGQHGVEARYGEATLRRICAAGAGRVIRPAGRAVRVWRGDVMRRSTLVSISWLVQPTWGRGRVR